jgi:hypothetical protein
VPPTPRVIAADLRIDGVQHELADVAVLPQRDVAPGGLRWSLVIEGEAAARLLGSIGPEIPARSQSLEAAPVPAPRPLGQPRGRPSSTVAARVLDQLRILLLRSGYGQPLWALNTIDVIDAGPTRLRLEGRCSPIAPGALLGPARGA